jgi:hypothetical protein
MFFDRVSAARLSGKQDEHRCGYRSLGIALSFVMRAYAAFGIGETAVLGQFPKEES